MAKTDLFHVQIKSNNLGAKIFFPVDLQCLKKSYEHFLVEIFAKVRQQIVQSNAT